MPTTVAHVLHLDHAPTDAALRALGEAPVVAPHPHELGSARVILGLDPCRLCGGLRRCPDCGGPCEVCTLRGGASYPVSR